MAAGGKFLHAVSASADACTEIVMGRHVDELERDLLPEAGPAQLVTTLTDARRYPVVVLTALHHQRWKHESAYHALRHTIMNGRSCARKTRPVSGRRGGPFSPSARPCGP